MRHLRYEIIDKLENVDEITSEIYENLLLIYDKKLVDSVIDGMIDEKNLLKYDFYISMKLSELNEQCMDSFKLYIRDMKKEKVFNYSDNKKYTDMVYDVIVELEKLFSALGYIIDNKYSIDNKVKYCFLNCKDVDKLRQLKELYDKYIGLRNKLIVGNLSLVVSMAKPYFKDNNDDLEIIQNGNEGLIRAIEKYNPGMNAGFSTYAYFWIRSGIISGLKQSNTLITMPNYVMELNSKIVRVIQRLKVQLGREPNNEEIADILGLSVARVKEVRVANDEVISLSFMRDEELLDESDDKEILVDKNADVLDDFVDSQDNCEFINKVKASLTYEEFYVLSKYYGLDDDIEKSYHDIGILLGKSDCSVKTIHKRALKKVRKKFNGYSVV